MGAEIDEGGHQHDAGRDIGRAAHDRPRHRAKAGVAEARFAPAVELGGHLVPPRRLAGRTGDDAHVVEAERQEHRLLEPLIDPPGPVGLFLGDARFAGIEQIERGLDRVAHRALGCQADFVALFEGVVDGFREVGVSHAGSPGQWRPLVGAGARRVKGTSVVLLRPIPDGTAPCELPNRGIAPVAGKTPGCAGSTGASAGKPSARSPFDVRMRSSAWRSTGASAASGVRGVDTARAVAVHSRLTPSRQWAR